VLSKTAEPPCRSSWCSASCNPESHCPLHANKTSTASIAMPDHHRHIPDPASSALYTPPSPRKTLPTPPRAESVSDDGWNIPVAHNAPDTLRESSVHAACVCYILPANSASVVPPSDSAAG